MKHLLLVFVSTVIGCASPTPRAGDPALDAALSGADRSPKNLARDVYRHPRETLTFFGLKPEDSVLEIEPGGGWYTEILAPYLAPKGHYVGAINPKYTGVVTWLKARPQLKASLVEISADGKIGGVPDRSTDLVLTFRNCHNWIGAGTAGSLFKEFFRVLKPGGTLGVEDHRVRGTTDAKSGYVREEDVIQLATAAGFRLVERSEVNANPKDTTKHPNGVWSLPPSLKGGDVDREKFLAIGESDRMTLKFIKP